MIDSFIFIYYTPKIRQHHTIFVKFIVNYNYHTLIKDQTCTLDKITPLLNFRAWKIGRLLVSSIDDEMRCIPLNQQKLLVIVGLQGHNI